MPMEGPKNPQGDYPTRTHQFRVNLINVIALSEEFLLKTGDKGRGGVISSKPYSAHNSENIIRRKNYSSWFKKYALSFFEKESSDVKELMLVGRFFQIRGPAKRTKLRRESSLEIEFTS